MNTNEFERIVSGICQAAGLEVIRLQFRNSDLGIAEADVFVSCTDAKAVYGKMRVAEKALTRHFAEGIRGGYYDAAIGYDDVPAGQAMLQFDCFPFSLDPAPAPALADTHAAVQAMGLPAVGQRVRLTEDVAVENWSLPCDGLEGEVIASTMDEIAVKLDRNCPDLAAWNNCILWNPTNEPAESGYEGALARFWRQVELISPSPRP